jgi:hypothetical protein
MRSPAIRNHYTAGVEVRARLSPIKAGVGAHPRCTLRARGDSENLLLDACLDACAGLGGVPGETVRQQNPYHLLGEVVGVRGGGDAADGRPVQPVARQDRRRVSFALVGGPQGA